MRQTLTLRLTSLILLVHNCNPKYRPIITVLMGPKASLILVKKSVSLGNTLFVLTV